jgi:hypothetical protein
MIGVPNGSEGHERFVHLIMYELCGLHGYCSNLLCDVLGSLYWDTPKACLIGWTPDGVLAWALDCGFVFVEGYSTSCLREWRHTNEIVLKGVKGVSLCRVRW